MPRFGGGRTNGDLAEMTMTTGILAISAKGLARAWGKGCKGIGVRIAKRITAHEPSGREIRQFFRESPDWIYLGGHFSGMRLYNYRKNDTRSVRFMRRRVKVTLQNADGVESSFFLSKRESKFNLHKKCKIVLWGGCSVCEERDTIEKLRDLFGQHLLLGYADMTGWKITNALLGGGKIHNRLEINREKSFFGRFDGTKLSDLEYIRRIWMQTALDAYGGKKYEHLIRAIDPNGQEWWLKNNKIKRGLKHT